jgi:hypothetical protein
MKSKEKEILSQLSGFHGSEHFYKDYLGVILTDGVKKLCELCNCYWIISDMAVILMSKFKDKEDFIVVKIRANEDKSCKIVLEDGNNNKLYEQKYTYTDFPLRKYEFWAVFNEVGTYTYMIPSEY